MLPKLLEFMNLDDVWRFKFPATFVFFAEKNDLPSEQMYRPNIEFIREKLAVSKLQSFAKFEPWSAATSGFVFPLSLQVDLPPTDTAEMF
jgi:hypothetical protein